MSINREQYAELMWTNYAKLIQDGTTRMRFSCTAKNVVRDWMATLVVVIVACLDVGCAYHWLTNHVPTITELVLILAIAGVGVVLAIAVIRETIKRTYAQINQLCNYMEVKKEKVKNWE